MEVIKNFIDKDTGSRYSKGQMYETADDKRIKYLQKRGFLKEEEKKEKAPTKKKKPKE